MKNIHLLPTDNKPSRLYFNVNDKEFQICEIEKPSTILKPNRHIYITSDKEIKDGDWFIFKDDNTYLFQSIGNTDNTHIKVKSINEYEYGDWNKDYCKKIILTTDQDLIKDGVQAIDDKFLEWFVKNPSYEEVVVEKDAYEEMSGDDFSKKVNYYAIIIPKEEPKQETLEEAGERVYPNNGYKDEIYCDLGDYNREKWIEGAKWQQQRSYSEEDMVNYALFILNNNVITVKEWFEQFKKK